MAEKIIKDLGYARWKTHQFKNNVDELKWKLFLLTYGTTFQQYESNKIKWDKTEAERSLLAENLKSNPILQEIMPFYLRQPGEEYFTRENLLELERKLLKLAGFEGDMAGFLKKVKKDTAIVTFMGGAGTRWEKGNKESTKEGDEGLTELERSTSHKGITPNTPRIFAPVDNLIPSEIVGQDQIANPVYNILAVKDLGSEHFVIYGGDTNKDADANRERIEREILAPAKTKATLIRQKIHPGKEKVSGIGDMFLQMTEDEEGKKAFKKKYIVVNQSSDENSFQTATLSLLSMYVFDKYGIDLSCILPTMISTEEKVPYPLVIDKNGLPENNHHWKDYGGDPPKGLSKQSNIGVRIYKAKALLKEINSRRPIYEKLKKGERKVDYYDEEYKYDHIEKSFMRSRAFLLLSLPIAMEEEDAHPFKAPQQREIFENDIQKVLAQDDEFGIRHFGADSKWFIRKMTRLYKSNITDRLANHNNHEFHMKLKLRFALEKFYRYNLPLLEFFTKIPESVYSNPVNFSPLEGSESIRELLINMTSNFEAIAKSLANKGKLPDQTDDTKIGQLDKRQLVQRFLQANIALLDLMENSEVAELVLDNNISMTDLFNNMADHQKFWQGFCMQFAEGLGLNTDMSKILGKNHFVDPKKL